MCHDHARAIGALALACVACVLWYEGYALTMCAVRHSHTKFGRGIMAEWVEHEDIQWSCRNPLAFGYSSNYSMPARWSDTHQDYVPAACCSTAIETSVYGWYDVRRCRCVPPGTYTCLLKDCRLLWLITLRSA